MTVGNVLGAVWRHKLAVLAVLVVCGLLVALNLAFATRQYTAEAVVSFSSTSAAANQTGIDGVGATISTVATTHEVLADVSQDLGGHPTDMQLANEVSAAWVQGTILVQISATNPDPQTAADIANQVALNLQAHLPRPLAVTLSTTESAAVPETASSPDVTLVVGAGGLLAVILAVLLALWRDREIQPVGTPSQVQQATRAPVLARLVDVPTATALPALEPGLAPNASFRRLRVAIDAVARDRHLSRITVIGTSRATRPVDVWVATNLAITLAPLRRRTLLVDARRFPEWGPPLPTRTDGPGLRGVLLGEDLESAVVPGPVERLDVLPSGSGEERLGDTDLEIGFDRLMEKAVTTYDTVVVLSPALETGDDALVLSIGASPLLVVGQERVSATDLERATADLRSVGAELLGTVLVTKPTGRERRIRRKERRARRTEAAATRPVRTKGGKRRAR